MKPTFLVVVALAGLISCATSVSKKFKYRMPSSIAAQEYSAQFTLFAGMGMPQEFVIAKSLPEAPLKVTIAKLPPGVHCKDSAEGREGTEFLLPSNRKGKYLHVSCSLDHTGSEYPEKTQLEVLFSVVLAEYEIPESEYKTKNQLQSYLTAIKDRTPWSAEMTSFIRNSIRSNTNDLSARYATPKILVDASEDDPTYVSLENFNGAIVVDGVFKDKPIGPSGNREKNKKYLYPTVNEYAIVCGTEVVDDGLNCSIANVLWSQGNIGEVKDMRESFACQFNYRKGEKKYNKNMNRELTVTYKAMRYSEIASMLERFIPNEEAQIESRVRNYYAQEFSRLKLNTQEIQGAVAEYEKKRDEVIKQVDRDKFVAYKNKLISDLFVEKISGKVSRSASNILVTPVKKIIYDEQGQQQAVLYLRLTNSIGYKVETSEFKTSEDRDLPFEEQVNIYLPTTEAFDKQTEQKIVICNDKVKAFYEVLGELQSVFDEEAISYTKVMDKLKKHSTNKVSSCALSAKDVKDIEYLRGRNKDYSIHFKKVKSGDEMILSALLVGAKYYADFLGKGIVYEVTNDGKGLHPAIQKNYVENLKKGEDQILNPELNTYFRLYGEEDFVKVGRP